VSNDPVGELADEVFAIHETESDTPSPTAAKAHPNWPDLTPPTPIQTWGVSLSADNLMGGLSPWPPNPPFEDQPPLSDLGHFADSTYKLGPLTLPEYSAQMREFIDVALPKSIRKKHHDELERYLPGGGKRAPEKWDVVKNVWQTDKDDGRVEDRMVKTWREGGARDEGWQWEMVTDEWVLWRLRG